MPTHFSPLKAVSCCGLLSLALSALAASPLENNLHQTFKVSPGGKLLVDADRGSIEIQTGSSQTVDIQVFRTLKGLSEAEAAKVFSEHTVSFDQRGNEILVQARPKERDWKWWGKSQSRLQVRYQISIPSEFNLDLKTAGGNVTVPDLKGEVKAGTSGGNLRLGKIDGAVIGKTSGGDISIGGASGTVEARTSGGSISVKSCQGALLARTSGGDIEVNDAGSKSDLETSGGSIRVGKATGKVLAKTTGGNIDVKESRTGVDASTSGGSISASFVGQPDGDCRLTTSGGDIHVNLPVNFAARVDARTSGGRVVSDLPVSVQGEQKATALIGQLGQGGSLLTLRTSGGNIHLRKTDKQLVRE